MQRTADIDDPLVVAMQTVSESDHDYLPLPEYSFLSQFVENIVVYVAGFVVHTLLRKTDCEMCCQVLKCSNTIVECQSDFGLIDLKDRDDLVRLSGDVVAVCKVAEWKVYNIIGTQQKLLKCVNARQQVTNELLAEFAGTDVFCSMDEDESDMEPVNNHQINLIRDIATHYINLRLTCVINMYKPQRPLF